MLFTGVRYLEVFNVEFYRKNSWYTAHCPLHGRCPLFKVSAKSGFTAYIYIYINIYISVYFKLIVYVYCFCFNNVHSSSTFFLLFFTYCLAFP